MPYCSNCGGEVDNEDRFCKHCGKSRTVGVSNASSKNISKCPRCGEIVNAFDITCRSCGYEFRNKDISISLQQFKDGIEKLDYQINNNPNRKDYSIYKQKAEYIRSFIIPNTKEDIFEFFILIASNIEKVEQPADKEEYTEVKNKKIINNAWQSKLEQVYQKAIIILKDSEELEIINDIYSNKKKVMEENTRTNTTPASVEAKMLVAIYIVIGVIFISFFFMFFKYTNNSDLNNNSKESELNAIVSEIQEDVKNGDFDSALLKANQLYYDGDNSSYSKNAKAHWDQQREEYIRIINEAKEKAEKGE